MLVACGSDAPPRAGDATLIVDATDPATDEPLALKVTFRGVGLTPTPAWVAPEGIVAEAGVELEAGSWLVDRTAVGAFGQVVVPLPPGTYQLTVSAGPERDVLQVRVTLASDEVRTLEATLPRAVDSAGYACADLHVHSAPSFDSSVSPEARLAAALAEGLDVMAPTDHDVVGDWGAAAATLDVDARLHILLGGEVSPGVGDTPAKGHFNVLPMPVGADMFALFPHPTLTVQEIVTAARMLAEDPVVQVNHPRWDASIGYFDRIGFDPLTGLGTTMTLADGFDAVEVWNGHELDIEGGGVGLETNLADWFGLLRHGHVLVATGSSDTHRLAKTPVGYPRTCVRVPDDRPSAIEDGTFLDALRGGDVFVTSGVMLDVSVEGQPPGATVQPTMPGVVQVSVRVSAAPWISADRLTVLRDGEVVSEMPIRGDAVPVELSVEVMADAFVVVLVEGDTPLPEAAGDHGSPLRSAAFTNPVFVDADGDGVWSAPG